MGSPEKPNKSTTSIIASTTSPQSTAFQDSPIFNYINNLSPIKPVKGTSVIQVFSGLNSPPLVFTSPQVRPHQQSIDLKSSHSQLSRQDDTGNISSGINLAPSENSCLENPENGLLKTTDSMNTERSIENYENEDNKGSYLLEEPDHDVEKDEKNGNYAKSNTGQNLTSNVLGKVGQSQLGKRRRLQFEAPQEKNSEISVEKLAHNIRNSSSIVSKPSGIGLHLNSVVNAMPLSYSHDGGKKSVSSSSHMQDNIKKYPSMSSNSNILENNSSKCEDNAHEASNRKAQSVKMLEYEETFDQVSLKSEQAERFDGMNRLNPKKKRKKTDSSGDGCKFCNCKKTKCLKLYCDCFAAGIYCADSCSCQGCFNRPEYEETVLETRQHIESRNPIAFAPKIVHRVTQSPRTQMEDGDQPASIAGRHKRGCNCKKSMCLKKYCECYQANVGCSDGCRCEGCKNIYGTKGVSGIIGEIGIEAINEKLNDSFDDKLKVGSHKPHNLTPQTPSFQCSNHGKNVSKARVFPGNYVVSPESGCTFNPNPYYTSTPTSPNDSDMITEASNKNLEMVTFDQESYPNIEFSDEFSPGDWSDNNSSRPQLLGCSSVGLCFRGSPVTLFSGTKPSFDDIIDDNSNTPEILKDSCIHQPNKVIATSPNKKRVSPPRIRLHELGSTSLKSGRKFILKAVPSFPPLTPCIDSKENTSGQTSNHPSGCNNL